MQFGQEANQVLKAAAQPIDRPSHDHIELTLVGIAAKGIEGRTLVPALSAADAVIPVHLDDLAAHSASDLAQLAFLIGGGLIDGRDAEIKNGSFHGGCLRFDGSTISRLYA